jgi:hypothetical protein
MVKDRTSSKFSTEHIGKRQRKVSPVGCNFVIFVGQTLRDNKLDISSGVLATVTGRIVAEGADTRVAVVTSVTTIATARLGTLLIPHLVVRVVEGIVLFRVNVVVVKTATMTTAPVRAASAAATTALKTIKAFAFASCVIASTTAGAFCVLVEVGTFGVQSLEGVLEVSWRDSACVALGRVCIEL